MRLYLYIIALLCSPLVTFAQQIYTSELAPFEMRKEAESRERIKREYYADFTPQLFSPTTYRKLFTRPDKWADRIITLHIENSQSAYELIINGVTVTANSDALTPTNIDVTNFLREGDNVVDVVKITSSEISTLQPLMDVAPFEGSYLVAQPYTHISDMDIELCSVGDKGEARLNISLQLTNRFSLSQPIEVGFDIYDPAGQLLDFSVNSFEVEAGAVDSISFSTAIYNTIANRWSPSNPKLYQVMVYVRRNGVATEYIPRSVALLDIEYTQGRITSFGKPITLILQPYTSHSTPTAAHTALQSLKKQGANAIQLNSPQPLWLYDMCQVDGLWIIEQPNINSVHSPQQKAVGGTPANDPKLVEEYLRRGRAAYYRTRDYDIILGYSLAGDESGNGYNLYKLYEWMKSEERVKPVIYRGGGGEWNSDIVEGL